MQGAAQASLAGAAMDSVKLRLDAGVTLPGAPALKLAVEIFLPQADAAGAGSKVLVCLPGGGMNRRFFDLLPSDGDQSFSFARHMRERGFIVVLVDHLGIGESDQPEDGYALTPDVLATANQQVAATVLKGMRDGTLIPDLPALPSLKSIGVGHSMGAMMTVLQQARAQQYDALVLLGFGTHGLPQFLKPEARELAKNQGAVRAELVRLARDMFVQPYPRIGRSPRGDDLYGSGKADPRGVSALKDAIEPLLPVPCFMSMLPDNVAPEAAQINVPVFVGVGERDMTGDPALLPAAYPASPAVTLHILPEAGHSHFLFPSRLGLFDRLTDWLHKI